MKIFIDGEPFTLSSSEETSKRKILAEVEEKISKKGLTYTNIIVDGVEMDSAGFLRLRKGMEAHFETCKIKSLVIESLEEAVKYLPRLTKGIKTISTDIEREPNADINDNLANFAEGLDWIVSVMQKSQVLLEVQDPEDSDKNETIENLNKSLKNISENFEKGNMRQIAYYMRQVLPEIQKFSGYIDRLLTAANRSE